MDVFPELHSKRLKLRKISVDDIPSLIRYANNKKIADHILNIPYPYGEPEAVFRITYVVQGFKSKARYVFAIIYLESEELIGEISLHVDNQENIAQLGYWVGEPFWGKGIATEATETILRFGFEKLDLAMTFAECSVENIASQRVLQKNGMKKCSITGGVVQYRLTRQEFEEQTNTDNNVD
jgi:[ribosomal protein S5]-alanine N-acetyltransferase